MKNNKATEEDEISIEAQKIGGQKLIHTLKILFNECILRGKTLDDWNNGIITLVYKIENIKNIGNYRPISFL